nr:hypothetical protein [Lachnospiraceae bacterium]
MKLLHTTFNDRFEEIISLWNRDITSNNYTAIFRVYIPYDYPDRLEILERIRAIIRTNAPDTLVIGCTSTGTIFDGKINDTDIIITASVFEDPDTKIQVVTTYEQPETYDTTTLLEYVNRIPDLKSIEIITAASYEIMEPAGKVIDALPENILIFGGVAVGDDVNKAFVFANDAPISTTGSVCVISSGKEFHIQANRIFGWKPIGYPLKVTKSVGHVVYEIDDKPAYEVYNHYLHIKKDDNFFYNALEFPLEVSTGDGTVFIRHA